jgi:hypothetical protein
MRISPQTVTVDHIQAIKPRHKPISVQLNWKFEKS